MTLDKIMKRMNIDRKGKALTLRTTGHSKIQRLEEEAYRGKARD